MNQSRRILQAVLLSLGLLCSGVGLGASDPDAAGDMDLHTRPIVTGDESDDDEALANESPWLIAPVVNSDPKLGLAGGLLVGYLHRFDPDSPVSMFGVGAVYSDTHSILAGAVANTYFGADRNRFVLAIGGGRIHNQYEDFLGTGRPFVTTDNVRALFTKYLRAVAPHWYVGIQATKTNYAIWSDSIGGNLILEVLGLTGFDSVGVGAVGLFDSRDNQNSPHSGSIATIANMAYREGLGSDDSYDTYSLDLRHYFPQGRHNTLGVRLNGKWTDDAPLAGNASIRLRGYKAGEYLAPYMASLEAEERFRIARRWFLTAYAGVACLYGDKASCTDSTYIYPAVAGGVQFVLKPKEKMVLGLEFAKGKGNNQGLYLRFGQGL